MTHNMNPFDFVPFPTVKPKTRTVKEWQGSGPLLTGWLEAKITALTPVHIVGKQEADGSGCKIISSHFYSRHGKAYIPASSIRGMLHAFIEAACNGWASQITPYYKKNKKDSGKRQIGFQAIDSREDLEREKELEKIDPDFRKKFALPDGFAMPQSLTEAQAENFEVDLASFLFGYIPPKGDAFHGRINIEDAPISSGNISFGNNAYKIPDIESDAFMGGGKPSASSWWYQKPYQIRLRPPAGNIVDFVGHGYRGRKFYYHQNPALCTAWYAKDYNWPKDSERPLYCFPIECLSSECATDSFRIYFEDLPENLMKLIIFALCPGKRLRHKIGYGKAYGYGSIEIAVLEGRLRGQRQDGYKDLDVPGIIRDMQADLWHKDKLNAVGIGSYLHWDSLEALAKIMWYAKGSELIFTYPRFNPGYQVTDESLRKLKTIVSPILQTSLTKLKDAEICAEKDFFRHIGSPPSDQKRAIRQNTLRVSGGFLPSVGQGDLFQVLNTQQKTLLKPNNPLPVTESEGRIIASKLAKKGKRPALHFDVYQEMAEGYAVVQGRKLQFAETEEGVSL